MPPEIEVPKELREFMPEGAEETPLGQKRGARRQYRYGRLHIREYDDRYMVHTDQVDPREDPAGHLLRDAPEFLAGPALGIIGGMLAARILRNRPKRQRVPLSLASAAVSAYIGYAAAKRLKGGRE